MFCIEGSILSIPLMINGNQLLLRSGQKVCDLADAFDAAKCNWSQKYYSEWAKLFPEFVNSGLNSEIIYNETLKIPSLGLTQSNFALERYAVTFDRIRPKRCLHCQSWFLGYKNRKYCSTNCQKERQKIQQRNWKSEKKPNIKKCYFLICCSNCNVPFYTPRKNKKFCKDKCRLQFWRHQSKKIKT